MLTQNQYCRQCGAQQDEEVWTDEFSSQVTVTLSTANHIDSSFSYTTTLLEKDFYQAVSAPLIKTATERLTAAKTAQLPNPLSKGLLVALVLVPI